MSPDEIDDDGLLSDQMDDLFSCLNPLISDTGLFDGNSDTGKDPMMSMIANPTNDKVPYELFERASSPPPLQDNVSGDRGLFDRDRDSDFIRGNFDSTRVNTPRFLNDDFDDNKSNRNGMHNFLKMAIGDTLSPMMPTLCDDEDTFGMDDWSMTN